eukprot:5207482-Prorocentrum_lima.AAC.1
MAVTIELPLLDIAKCIVELGNAHRWEGGNWEPMVSEATHMLHADKPNGAESDGDSGGTCSS